MSWYWQKDLRKKDTVDAWEPYSVEENKKLETAFNRNQKTMKLSKDHKIDFSDMIQFRIEDRDRQRAIKRVAEGEVEREEEEEEEEKPAKKAKIEKKEKGLKKEAKQKKEETKKKATKKTSVAPKMKKIGKKSIKAIIEAKLPRESDDFYITSGKVVCGGEHHIFEYEAGTNDGAPARSGNELGFPVKNGKWTFFQSQYIQACYHESVPSTFINKDYLQKVLMHVAELSQQVYDNFSTFWKETPKPCKDFRVSRSMVRYDWGVIGDGDRHCLFTHFVDKEKAKELIEGHNTLGQCFWDELLTRISYQ